jgi:hypothetical protein
MDAWCIQIATEAQNPRQRVLRTYAGTAMWLIE